MKTSVTHCDKNQYSDGCLSVSTSVHGWLCLNESCTCASVHNNGDKMINIKTRPDARF